MDNLETKINSIDKNCLGDDIVNDLQQIINYINENILIKKKENDDEINLDEEDAQNEENEFSENKKEMKVKLGKKRKKDKLSEKNKEKLNEAKVDKLKEYQNHVIEIIKLIKNIVIKMNNNLINDNKKNNNDIINNQEIKYNDGKYIGQVLNGLKEGKGIMYYNDGDRYEGEFRNDKREGKESIIKKRVQKLKVIFKIINYKEKLL